VFVGSDGAKLFGARGGAGYGATVASLAIVGVRVIVGVGGGGNETNAGTQTDANRVKRTNAIICFT
jgi:hypothetical protein